MVIQKQTKQERALYTYYLQCFAIFDTVSRDSHFSLQAQASSSMGRKCLVVTGTGIDGKKSRTRPRPDVDTVQQAPRLTSSALKRHGSDVSATGSACGASKKQRAKDVLVCQMCGHNSSEHSWAAHIPVKPGCDVDRPVGLACAACVSVWKQGFSMDGSWEQVVRKASEDSVYKTSFLDAVGLITKNSHKNLFPNAVAQDESFFFYVS